VESKGSALVVGWRLSFEDFAVFAEGVEVADAVGSFFGVIVKKFRISGFFADILKTTDEI